MGSAGLSAARALGPGHRSPNMKTSLFSVYIKGGLETVICAFVLRSSNSKDIPSSSRDSYTCSPRLSIREPWVDQHLQNIAIDHLKMTLRSKMHPQQGHLTLLNKENLLDHQAAHPVANTLPEPPNSGSSCYATTSPSSSSPSTAQSSQPPSRASPTNSTV